MDDNKQFNELLSDAADQAADLSEAAGAATGAETGETLRPEAAFAEEMMADRGSAGELPIEELPIEELPLADRPAPPEEKPKWSKGKLAAAIIGGLALCAALVLLVIMLGRGKATQPPVTLTDEEIGEHSLVDMNKMLKYGAFAYSDESLAEKYNAEIIAKVGNHELTNGLLQIFYWSTVYNDLNENADYLSFRGPDVDRPLAEQKYGETVTWEQHYLQNALDYYLQNVALYEDAEKSGTTLSPETQEMLDNLPGNLAAQASEYGFDNVEDYIAQSFGPGVSMDDYLEYYRLASMAFAQASALQQNVQVTDDEVEAFFDAHAEEFAAQGVEKTDQNMVNVRHILVMPERDIDSDDDLEPDASSEEAWAAAEQGIREIFDVWKKDPTEENFAKMAASDSSDTGSAQNGGLYEGVYPGQMVEEFNDWCFDPSRKPGDTDIVRTSYGFHLMYFSSTGDRPYWRTVAESECIYDKFNQVIDALFTSYKLDVDYAKLHIYDIVSRSNAQDAAEDSGDQE